MGGFIVMKVLLLNFLMEIKYGSDMEKSIATVDLQCIRTFTEYGINMAWFIAKAVLLAKLIMVQCIGINMINCIVLMDQQ